MKDGVPESWTYSEAGSAMIKNGWRGEGLKGGVKFGVQG